MIKVTKYFVLLIAIVSLIFSCEKVDDNKIPPVIFLKGKNPAIVRQGCSFEDPGADISDDKSNPTLRIDGVVNPDSSGVYLINYTAIDSDSNMAYAQRRVFVEPIDILEYLRSYSVIDTLLPLNQILDPYSVNVDTVEMSNPLKLSISNFNNYGEQFKVLFAPDSTGSFDLYHNSADTIIIEGAGTSFCDKSGFRIDYLVTTTGNQVRTHKATFR